MRSLLGLLRRLTRQARRCRRCGGSGFDIRYVGEWVEDHYAEWMLGHCPTCGGTGRA